MDINTIKEHGIPELFAGYIENRKGAACLWCDARFENAIAAERHINEAHSPFDRLSVLLHSSALGFTENERRALEMMFLGKGADQIERRTGLKDTSIRGIRRRVYRKELEAKAALMFCGLWAESAGQPALRGYKKKSFDALFGIDGDGRVTGGGPYTIAQLHSGDNPVRHATAIILVARLTDGTPRYLVVNKAAALQRHTPGKETKKALDLFGGHMKGCDISPVHIDLRGFQTTAETYRKTAVRELTGELVVNKRPLAVDTALFELFETDYKGAFAPYGTNYEHSFVYLFVLPENVAGKDIRCYDEYADSLSERVRRRYRAKFMDIKEIMAEYASNKTSMNDGLLRVVERLMADPPMLRRVEALVSDMRYRQDEAIRGNNTRK